MASTITQEIAHDPKRFPNLETVVGRRLWPTPTAVTRPMEGNVRLYRAKIEAGEMTEAEAEAILGKSVWEAQGKVKEKWPTPTHGKLAGGSGAFQKIADLYSDGTISDEERKAMQAGNGGKLNPTWVEWLMGFPTGWTDLKD
jgi:DNA (cytosine-5)-methyltransferase 1